MKLKLVTSLNKQLYEQYAKDNFKSWVEYLHLPEGSEIEVWFWGEIPKGLPQRTNNGTPFKYKMFDVQSEGWQYFINTFKNHPRPKTQPGQEYVFNFIPFSCKVYALAEAAWEIKTNEEFTHIAWLDADVELLQTLAGDNLKEIIGNTSFAWLDRSPPWQHGETGFMLAKGDSDTLDLFLQVANCYGSGQLFHFAQWHDAYIFTSYIKLKQFTEASTFLVKNLNEDLENTQDNGLHPFKTSVLSKFMRHDKGQLKFKKEQRRNPDGTVMFEEPVFQ